MTRIKALLCLLVAAIIGLNYMRYGHQPEPFAEDSQSYQLLQRGPFAVVAKDIELEDYSRATKASGKFPGSDYRSLLTRIWRPERPEPAEPGPLLIYNHGFLSSRVGGTFLARHLASHGYIVAAADFPLTNMESHGPQRVSDIVNQPGDVSFIIDHLLTLNSDPSSPLYGAIDPEKIATAGMSTGGMTASLLAFHPTMSDSRIAAAISIAGPSHVFTRQFYRFRDVPFMMISSPIDAVIDYQTNALPILEQVSRGVLVSIQNASHTGFSFQARALRWLDNPDRIGCWAIRRKHREESPWGHLIGSTEQGIEGTPPVGLCTQNDYPEAMNPIAQQRLATLAASSFLQSLFASDDSERQLQAQFLYQQLAQENPEVTVQATRGMIDRARHPMGHGNRNTAALTTTTHSPPAHSSARVQTP